ncbi:MULTISPECIES: glycerol-3-phosphate 1-O-acyltransferase PlsY [unclassified Streptococcus]|uniref:glycerol-3-phosphate 1-O-acyltransferase PlsY n=1 Tax=unclassified Streptococcus TaxID=2608887 RepID=UPI00107167AA|nr:MULTISPECIES: glycerol-3-phosphate 1-O-acyltransferase PlsY [unclassified Streptococcus]MBF0806255.1 glycerol-3-phosphate 1-O-acyltransferase PlsY [Streptococcus sp. 19428wA2_WM07]TFU28165.1 glycerol-3-phosphate 1-O-acyltransferase PlsY [Streptococcus sp. WM07]
MIILCFLIAYLLGSIPTGLWIGQHFFNIDLRTEGSGNTGTTNTFRILGKQAGMITFLIDFFKGSLATYLPILLGLPVSPILFGLAAVLGHVFPIFAHFKGGKAVATSAGAVFAYSFGFFIYMAIIFFGVLYLFSMISLSSMAAAIAAILGVLIFPAIHFLIPEYDTAFTLTIIGIALLILIRHRSNVVRILDRKENIIPWGINLSQQKPEKAHSDSKNS